MRGHAVSWSLVACGLLLSGVAHADPPTSSALPKPSAWQRLELEFPLLKPLHFSFSADPVPGFEPLGLPTFRSESLWWQRGALSLRTFSQVAPSLELDCSVTCQPMLERSLGAEGRVELGGLGRAVPMTYFFTRAQQTQVIPSVSGAAAKPRSGSLISAGFGGLLDF